MGGILVALVLPFVGTTLGAACVYFMKKGLSAVLEKTLIGFAAGVMVAASVWSLLIPAMEGTGTEGWRSVMPHGCGLYGGYFVSAGS